MGDKKYNEMDVGQLNITLSDTLNELEVLYGEYNKQTQELSTAQVKTKDAQRDEGIIKLKLKTIRSEISRLKELTTNLRRYLRAEAA